MRCQVSMASCSSLGKSGACDASAGARRFWMSVSRQRAPVAYDGSIASDAFAVERYKRGAWSRQMRAIRSFMSPKMTFG